MSDDFDPTDPFERWNQAWFSGPLVLDFGVRAQALRRGFLHRLFSKSPSLPGPTSYRLQPVCLGHLIYLQALSSPILQLGNMDAEIGIPDFLSALRVLRDARWPFTAEIDFSTSPEDELLLEAHLAARHADQPSPIERTLQEQFLPWWLRGQAGPELLHNTDSGGRSLTAPYALSMAVRLLRTGSFDEQRIYTMPLSLLRFYGASISEQDGAKVAFMTPELLAAMKQAAARPDLSKLPDDEQFALVVKLRGQAFADRWRAHRHEYQRILAEKGKAIADAWARSRSLFRGRRKESAPSVKGGK